MAPRAEPSFVRAVGRALGGARTVLEVVAGPEAPSVVADGRTTTTLPAASDQPRAGDLPFDGLPFDDLPFGDHAFDAAVATLSLRTSDDVAPALAELRRVARGPVVVLTRDPARITASWLAEYAPAVAAADAARYPPLDQVTDALHNGPDTTVVVTRLATPFTCVDPFSESSYGRPERLLDPVVRRADPAWALVDEMTATRSVGALRRALADGTWDAAHRPLRTQLSHDGSVVLVTAIRGA